jgi:predicted glutamate--cysteine ligase
VWSVLEDPTIDPLSLHDDEALQVLVRDNEEAAACQSLDAELRDWQTGRTVRAKDWIAERVESLGSVLRSHGLDQYMPTLLERLETGSTAQCWLEQVRRGRTVESVIEEATREMADQDVEVMGAECS